MSHWLADALRLRKLGFDDEVVEYLAPDSKASNLSRKANARTDVSGNALDTDAIKNALEKLYKQAPDVILAKLYCLDGVEALEPEVEATTIADRDVPNLSADDYRARTPLAQEHQSIIPKARFATRIHDAIVHQQDTALPDLAKWITDISQKKPSTQPPLLRRALLPRRISVVYELGAGLGLGRLNRDIEDAGRALASVLPNNTQTFSAVNGLFEAWYDAQGQHFYWYEQLAADDHLVIISLLGATAAQPLSRQQLQQQLSPFTRRGVRTHWLAPSGCAERFYAPQLLPWCESREPAKFPIHSLASSGLRFTQSLLRTWSKTHGFTMLDELEVLKPAVYSGTSLMLERPAETQAPDTQLTIANCWLEAIAGLSVVEGALMIVKLSSRLPQWAENQGQTQINDAKNILERAAKSLSTGVASLEQQQWWRTQMRRTDNNRWPQIKRLKRELFGAPTDRSTAVGQQQWIEVLEQPNGLCVQAGPLVQRSAEKSRPNRVAAWESNDFKSEDWREGPADDQFVIDGGGWRRRFKRIDRFPEFANGIARKGSRLRLHTKRGDLLRWFDPGVYRLADAADEGANELLIAQGFWATEATAEQLRFAKPEWASRHGVDAYGYWAEFGIAGVIQRMRWLPPGEFRMGSSASEQAQASDSLVRGGMDHDDAQRWVADEGPAHSVLLSVPTWIADTACTQALYSAISDENPSVSISDPEHPVTDVSWEDISAWLDRLNREYPSLMLRLPSEAEWEYACRAGALTAFNSGDDLLASQACFDYARPWAASSAAQSAKATVAVKHSRYAANAWGLWQMHGNVEEWCADDQRVYSDTGAVLDPLGPQADAARRVLRGGAWRHPAADARCAFRNRDPRDGHWHGNGFRLARGPVKAASLGPLATAQRGSAKQSQASQGERSRSPGR